MRSMLTVSIDFDDTFTADPDTWTEVIRVLQRSGHVVICTSARRNDLDNRRELENSLPGGVCVLLSYDEPKRSYAKKQGYDVDIWIDDMPEAIPTKQECLKLCS